MKMERRIPASHHQTHNEFCRPHVSAWVKRYKHFKRTDEGVSVGNAPREVNVDWPTSTR